MIYTVTCNPSLDYSMQLDVLKLGGTNRVEDTALAAGGKGLNVSMVLDRLGMKTTALGFVAGFVGNEIELRMGKSGCCCRFVHLPTGCSRMNVKLRGNGETTELNAPGPDISAQSLAELTRQLELLEPEDGLVLAGSLPPTMPKTAYADWMARLSRQSLQIVVDTTGEALLQTLAYHPFLIKPNHDELGELFGVQIDSREKAAIYGKKLQERGARNVLVSMSGNGAVLCTEDGVVLEQEAAKGTVVQDVGAGDSMIAGFLTGWMRTKSYATALRLGTAAGAATAFSRGLATAEEVKRLENTLPFPTEV